MKIQIPNDFNAIVEQMDTAPPPQMHTDLTYLEWCIAHKCLNLFVAWLHLVSSPKPLSKWINN